MVAVKTHYDIPCHAQGAIQMAQWELDNGSNAQLRNLSSTIIAEQTREIQQMQGYLMQLPACAPAPAPAPVCISCLITSTAHPSREIVRFSRCKAASYRMQVPACIRMVYLSVLQHCFPFHICFPCCSSGRMHGCVVLVLRCV